jgi:hypothetical protein
VEVFPIPDNIVSAPGRYLTYGEMYVMDQFQRHLVDLAIWTRALVIALKFKLPDVENIYERLLDETNDTRDIMASFFGPQNALIYENYLIELITGFRHLTEALLSNDVQKADESYKSLNQMADNMSEFFYELNPSTSLDQWHSLIHGYVDMLYNEIYTIASGNLAGSIDLFDTIVDQSYQIANNISNTVISFFQSVPTTQPSTTPPATSPPAGTALPK